MWWVKNTVEPEDQPKRGKQIPDNRVLHKISKY